MNLTSDLTKQAGFAKRSQINNLIGRLVYLFEPHKFYLFRYFPMKNK